MNTKLLVDSIVRQTTVLIAQLCTAAGVRAPLAQIADAHRLMETDDFFGKIVLAV